MLPGLLFGLGLLGANDYMQRGRRDDARSRVEELLGAPGQPQEQGGSTGGTGLLGGQMTPEEFYGGLLSTPGYEQYGARGMEALTTPTGQGVNPAAVREWEYFNKLPPEQQAKYLTMKRADPTFSMGDVPMIGNQVNRTAQPWQEVPPQMNQAAPQAAMQQAASQAELQRRLSEQKAQEAGMVQEAKVASERGSQAFDQLGAVKSNIANYDEAIRLIDEGAQTGVVASKFPSIKQASIALDNLQSRLGLNVVGNTTFGALSEAELKFALDTALPKKMQPQELRKWLQDKKEAQQKLASYLEQAATFLGTPGNTVAKWIELQKQNKSQQAQPTQGGAKFLGFE